MAYAPVLLTWATGTATLTRAGDEVSCELVITTSGAGAAQVIPEEYRPRGSSLAFPVTLAFGLNANAAARVAHANFNFTGPDLPPGVEGSNAGTYQLSWLANAEAADPFSELNPLLINLPGYGLLTDSMKQNALNGALIPDAAGVWPGEPNYVTTYDVYFAAISLIGFLQAQPVIRQSSSEGTSIAVDAPNWSGLLAWYRSMSPICQGQSSPILSVLPIPDGPHVVRVDMQSRGDGYGDVDTDLT